MSEQPVQPASTHALIEFFRRCAAAAWQGGDVDGGTIQEWGVELGLLREEPYDPARHGDNDVGAEPGDPWFVLADVMLAQPAQPRLEPLHIVIGRELLEFVRDLQASKDDFDTMADLGRWIDENVLPVADALPHASAYEAISRLANWCGERADELEREYQSGERERYRGASL